MTIGLGAAMTSKTTQTWVNFFSLVATIILLSTINDFKCRTTQTSIILTIVVAVSIICIIIVAIIDVITNVTISVILTVVIAMILMISIVSNVFFIALALAVQTNMCPDLRVNSLLVVIISIQRECLINLITS